MGFHVFRMQFYFELSTAVDKCYIWECLFAQNINMFLETDFTNQAQTSYREASNSNKTGFAEIIFSVLDINFWFLI